MMRPFVLEFGYDIRVDDIIYNDWSIYCIKSASSGGLVVGWTFKTKNDVVNVVNQWHIAHSLEY